MLVKLHLENIHSSISYDPCSKFVANDMERANKVYLQNNIAKISSLKVYRTILDVHVPTTIGLIFCNRRQTMSIPVKRLYLNYKQWTRIVVYTKTFKIDCEASYPKLY